MAFDIGGPQFGLRDAKIGLWQDDNTYTSQQDVFSVQVLSIKSEVESQDLEGDDAITATAQRTKKGTVTLKMGGIDRDALFMFTGSTSYDSGLTPNVTKVLKVSNKKARYIGLCGQALAEEGDGDTHLFIPKAKVSQPFEIKFEINTFSIPEIQLTAVMDTTYDDGEGNPSLWHLYEHETAVSVALPPAGSF